MENMTALTEINSKLTLHKKLQKEIITEDDGTQSISVFRGVSAPVKIIKEQVEVLSTLFPDAFGKEAVKRIFVDAIIENQFPQEKLFAAVKHVRDTFTGYGQPKIGDIINFDKKIKIFTRSDLQKKHAESYYPGAKYDPIASEYVIININDEPRFIKKEDYREGLFVKWVKVPENNTVIKPIVIGSGNEDLSIAKLTQKMHINDVLAIPSKYNPKKFSEEEKEERRKRFEKILKGGKQ